MKIKFIVMISFLTISSSVFSEDCNTYAKKLESCTPFTCEYSHPMVNQKMKKSIIGMKNGKCETTEEMPNKGRLDCVLSPKSQAGIAKQLNELGSKSTSGDTKLKMETNSGSTSVNSQSVDADPLRTAMTNGECKVSGY